MNFIHFLFRALIVFSEEKCVKKTLCLDENMQIKKFHIFNAFLVQSSPLQLTQRLTSCIKVNKPIKSQIHSSNANHLFSRWKIKIDKYVQFIQTRIRHVYINCTESCSSYILDLILFALLYFPLRCIANIPFKQTKNVA